MEFVRITNVWKHGGLKTETATSLCKVCVNPLFQLQFDHYVIVSNHENKSMRNTGQNVWVDDRVWVYIIGQVIYSSNSQYIFEDWLFRVYTEV